MTASIDISPHNPDAQGACARLLAGKRARASDGPLRRRGRGPARRPRRRRAGRRSSGWSPRARRSRDEVEPRAARAGVSVAGLGHAGARDLRAALGASPPGRCASRCGACATPATSARCCARRCAFGASSVALGPGTAPTRTAPKAVRAQHGGDLRGAASRAERRPSSDAAAASTAALAASPASAMPGAGRAGRGARGGRRSLVGAEREGLPGRCVAAAATQSPTSRSASESLNAAMAATVALYELTRRMRRAP